MDYFCGKHLLSDKLQFCVIIKYVKTHFFLHSDQLCFVESNILKYGYVIWDSYLIWDKLIFIDSLQYIIYVSI